jgi:hypothetical protein
VTEVFITLIEVFSCFFLSCKANARAKLAKKGHGPHSSTLVVICVVRLLFVLFCVLSGCKCVLPPGDNPTAHYRHIKFKRRGITQKKTYKKHTYGKVRSVKTQLIGVVLIGFVDVYWCFNMTTCFDP